MNDRDLDGEIRAHLDEATDDYIRRGMSPAEARRAARLDFGSVVAAQETYRDVRGRRLHDLGGDLRYALRSLQRNPGFSIVAIVSLALGIGVNTAIFSLVNSILLRPLPISAPDRLVELYVGTHEHPFETCSAPSYRDLRDGNAVFSGLAAYGIRQFRLRTGDDVEPAWGEIVSENYFDVLGVRAGLGRALAASDEGAPGSDQVVVISDGLWRRRFGGDPDALGKTLAVNGQRLTVVGVAPPGFSGMMRGLASEVWVPLSLVPALEPIHGQLLLDSRDARWLSLLGRLRPDATFAQARAHLDLLSRDLQARHAEEWRAPQVEGGPVRELWVSALRERDARVHPGLRVVAYGVSALLVMITALVVLSACMNLASMQLARAVARRKEIAVRLTLGAGRWRIIRQLLVESLVLALVAGAGGVVLTVWMLDTLLALLPPLPEGIRVALDLGLDWRVLAFATLFSTATGVLFGLVPALQATRPDVAGVLQNDSSGVTARYRRSRAHRALVVLQVTCSVLLLIGAGLAARSLGVTTPARLGYSSENLLIVPLTLDETRHDRSSSQDFFRQVGERVAALEGVQGVALADAVPGGLLGRARRSIEIEGHHPAPGESLEIDSGVVGPHYFTQLEVPVVQGRDFDERDIDGAPCVTVVNEAFVQRYFPGPDPALGRHLMRGGRSGVSSRQTCEVVGVVRDDRFQSLQKSVQPYYAMALLQSDERRAWMLVRTRADPAGRTPEVRRIVRALDPEVPLTDVRPLTDTLAATLYPLRALSLFLGACGAMSLLLAAIGVYGIVAYSAAQRTREVGIRMALGALRTDVLGLVVGDGMKLVAAGLTLGLIAGFALTRALASSGLDAELLPGVEPTDALTFLGVTLLLAGIAVLACYLPARRAANADAVLALRHE